MDGFMAIPGLINLNTHRYAVHRFTATSDIPARMRAPKSYAPPTA